MDKKECALAALHCWMTEAESFLESAVARDYSRHRHIALGYLQQAAELGFKAAIVSLGGQTLRSRNPYALCKRCRRLLPLLDSALILSPAKQKLFHFLLPAFGLFRGSEAPLPDALEWKELLQHVRELLQLIVQLSREHIDNRYR